MDTAKLESFIFDKMSATRLPGLSISLVKGDETVYSRGFGLADIARGASAKPETLYGAASITKSFIAIAILQLAEKQKLKLTDPANQHAPDSPFEPEITIEHLLTHTSGLPAIGYIEAVLRHAHNIGGCNLAIGSPRDAITFARGADDWLETKPGERWFYLNKGYVLLGEIVARASGMPYEKYITDNILKPLGMSRSFFAEADCTRDGELATPYVIPKDNGALRPGKYLYNVLGGDAALVTNALDLARYVQMFLHRGRGVLSEDAFNAMIQPRIPLPTGVSKYCYGLSRTENFLGEPIIGHAGSLIVVTSYFAFMPKSNVGVAVLSNGSGYVMSQFAKVALAILLGHEPTELPFVRTDDTFTALSGHYETYRGTVRVKITKDGEFLRMEYFGGDQPPAPVVLVPETLDGDEPRFFTLSDGAKLPIEFHRKSGGAVEMIYERYKFKRTGPIPTS